MQGRRNVTKSDNSSVAFRYDAAGNRIAKIADNDSTVYVRDASGNVMAVYRNDALTEQSIYGSSRLGLHLKASKPGYRTLGYKQYELSNHLGNVLTTVRDRIQLSTDSTSAEVSSISDYYPFGLAMEGRSLQDSSYRYGFNGKENDRNGEWGSQNHYDYGFRIYNLEIGKFLSVDPLTKSYPMLTPYQFASNRPIDGIDLDGLEFFKKGTLYDFKVNIYTLNDKEVIDLRLIDDKIALSNHGLSKLIEKNHRNIGFNNARNGVDLGNSLINDSKSELFSTTHGFGKALMRIGRVTATISAFNQVADDIENINKKAVVLNKNRLANQFKKDKEKASWFADFLNEFANSPEARELIFEDASELEEFINFSFDNKPTIKKVEGSTRFEGFDFKKYLDFQNKFKVLEEFYNVNNDFKNTNNSLKFKQKPNE